jgi:hypothetical protein
LGRFPDFRLEAATDWLLVFQWLMANLAVLKVRVQREQLLKAKTKIEKRFLQHRARP